LFARSDPNPDGITIIGPLVGDRNAGKLLRALLTDQFPGCKPAPAGAARLIVRCHHP
jgi:hypothetical protein